MPFIQLNNANIYYEDEGKGDEIIVFGHSMLFNLRMFDDQVKYLKPNYRCIRFDFRGHGKSEVTPDGYDLDSLTEDVAELIQNLNVGPCHFLGFSMGGMTALRLAVKYPGLIKSLILIDTSSEPEPKDNLRQNQLLLWITKYFGIRPISNRIMSMFFGKSFLSDPKRTEIKKTWKEYLLSNDHIGIARVVKSVLARTGVTKDLYKISVPTLILIGENDILTAYDKSEILKKEIKNSELKVIPSSGHMAPVEEPVIVNALIGDFLYGLQSN